MTSFLSLHLTVIYYTCLTVSLSRCEFLDLGKIQTSLIDEFVIY